MGLAKVIDSSTNDNGEPSAKVEIYKNDNANAKIFNPSGVEARPLDGDFCFIKDSEDTEGGKDVLGFIDPKNETVSEKGEHRTYSRDEDGNIVAAFHLKKDGSLQIDLDKDFIQNIAGNINQTIDGNVIIKATKFSFGDGTNELISEAIKGLKEAEKLVGSSLLAGNVDLPGVSSTGTNSLITGALSAMETALGNVITALEAIKV